jgi:hypothetical protein
MSDVCPNCDKSYERLGSHWNSCGFPNLSHEQKQIITGLVMSDAQINRREGRHPRIKMETTNPEYLSYLDTIFGIFSTGGPSMRRSADELSNRETIKRFEKSTFKDQYSWSSRSLPELERWANWYQSGEKVWPKDVSMTPKTLKHFYVGDGTLHNENRFIQIYLSNERKNKNKINEYFTSAGLPKPKWNEIERVDGSVSARIRWTVKQSQELLDYMGEPLPGFEYKW